MWRLSWKSLAHLANWGVLAGASGVGRAATGSHPVPPGYRFFKPAGLFGIKAPEEPYSDGRLQEDSKSLAGPCAGGCRRGGRAQHGPGQRGAVLGQSAAAWADFQPVRATFWPS